MIVALIVLWFALSFIAFGFMRGAFAHKFPAFNNNYVGYIAFIPVVGFISALIFCATIGGWRFKLSPSTRASRWGAHQRLWPSLSQDLSIETFE